jgi:hypothetical protein
MRELLIGQSVGSDPLDGLEERRLGEVGGTPPHRREQFTHELGKPLRPGFGHGVGGVLKARHRAVGIQRK